MQEDLTSLFDRSLSLQQPQPHQIQYSITQHYHHSSHQSSPSHTIQTPRETAIALLTSHNIDPSRLSPAQQQLFTSLPLDQQIRLIQIWQASPPEAPFHTPSATTINQEEEFARARLERQEWAANRETYGFSSTPNLALMDQSQGQQGMIDHHNNQTEHAGSAQTNIGERRNFQHDQAEPYIVSGYSAEAEYPSQGGYQHMGSAVGGVAITARPSAPNNWAYEYNRATDPVYSNAASEGQDTGGDAQMS